jgi:hypothetical protein
MKLKIVIVDLELSARAKKLLIRIGVPLAVLLGGATLAYAGGWALPNQWSAPGSPNYAGPDLKASDLDDNFAALVDAGASLDQRVTNLENAAGRFITTIDGGQYSVGATYCGSGPSTSGIIPNGYAGAKLLCTQVQACNSSPSTHMCTGEDIVRSMALGVSVGVGWYSSGSGSSYDSNNIDDCVSWTVATPASATPDAHLGRVWNGWGQEAYCDQQNPILCCD